MTNYQTLQAIENEFRAVMAAVGVISNDSLIPDGELHRFHVEGDRRGSKNGAYVLHADGQPAGYFEHFRTGIRQTWHMHGKPYRLTDAERRQIEDARRQREAERQDATTKAAAKARYIWSVCQAAPSDHPYLVKKKIKPHHARQSRDGRLVISLFDQNKTIVNVQFIDHEGNKRFLTGAQKKGAFAVIGEHQDGEPILICEGWATGASLHEHTGKMIIVALDAGNLEPVAKVTRALYTNVEIIICGDNDLSGVGQTKARAAALAVGGKYLIPPTPGNDWNDELTRESEI